MELLEFQSEEYPLGMRAEAGEAIRKLMNLARGEVMVMWLAW